MWLSERERKRETGRGWGKVSGRVSGGKSKPSIYVEAKLKTRRAVRANQLKK